VLFRSGVTKPWAARGDGGTPLEQLIEQTGPFKAARSGFSPLSDS